MNMPRRLIHDDPRSLESILARSAIADGPSEASRRRIYGALGLTASAVAVGSMAAAAGSTAKSGALFPVAGKWILISIFGGTLATAGAIASLHRSAERSEATSPSAVVAPTSNANHEAKDVPPATADVRVVTPEDLPLVMAPPAGTPNAVIPGGAGASSEPGQAPEPAADALARELKLVDEARSALRNGDARGALALLDQHDRNFGAGRMSMEVLALRIEALWRTGQREQASSMATQFLAAHPNSPLCERVRPYARATARDAGGAP